MSLLPEQPEKLTVDDDKLITMMDGLARKASICLTLSLDIAEIQDSGHNYTARGKRGQIADL